MTSFPSSIPAGSRSIIIREFIYPDDYAEVIDLWNTAGPGVHVRRSDTPEEIEKKLSRDPDLFLVALARDAAPNDSQLNKIVGSVLGGFDGRRGMMYHLAVRHDYRRQGVAAMLVDELENRLRQKGCIRYYLMVTTENNEAIRFYENRGWERMRLYTYAKDLD